MTALLADENFSLDIVLILRAVGRDVMTAREAGIAGRGVADELVLRTATELDRAVVTFDRYDYARLHRRIPGHAGIILCRDIPDLERLATDIDRAIAAAGTIRGRLLRLRRDGSWSVE
jgi:hypothetical protein